MPSSRRGRRTCRNGLTELGRKKLFIKQADVYGSYLAMPTIEIGRVIQASRTSENSTILDHLHRGATTGPAPKACSTARLRVHHLHGIPVPVKDQFLCYPFWGSDRTSRILRRVGLGDGHAVQWVKQVPVALRRDRPGGGHVMAGHITDVGGTVASSPCYRHRAHHPRSDRHSTPRRSNGIKQIPMEGVRWPTPGIRECQRADQAPHTILRDARKSRHLQGMLVAATTPATKP